MKLLSLFFATAFTVMHCTSKQSSANRFRPLVIAHRGMPYHAPEETAPSYLMAIAAGAHYLEADLQRCKDGVIICLHDEDLRRTTNVSEIFPARAAHPVSEFTYKELMQLDAGSWFNKAYPEKASPAYIGLKILTLDELIDMAQAAQVGLYLETKQSQLFPGIEKQLNEQLDAKGVIAQKDKLILQTFEKESMTLLQHYFPHTPKCMLLWHGPGYMESTDMLNYEQWLNFACESGAEYIGPSIPGELTGYTNLMEEQMLKAIQIKGLKIHAYTFDTPADYHNFGKYCDGIFTNRSDIMR